MLWHHHLAWKQGRVQMPQYECKSPDKSAGSIHMACSCGRWFCCPKTRRDGHLCCQRGHQTTHTHTAHCSVPLAIQHTIANVNWSSAPLPPRHCTDLLITCHTTNWNKWQTNNVWGKSLFTADERTPVREQDATACFRPQTIQTVDKAFDRWYWQKRMCPSVRLTIRLTTSKTSLWTWPYEAIAGWSSIRANFDTAVMNGCPDFNTSSR